MAELLIPPSIREGGNTAFGGWSYCDNGGGIGSGSWGMKRLEGDTSSKEMVIRNCPMGKTKAIH